VSILEMLNGSTSGSLELLKVLVSSSWFRRKDHYLDDSLAVVVHLRVGDDFELQTIGLHDPLQR
jgi:hypothetical protein